MAPTSARAAGALPSHGTYLARERCHVKNPPTRPKIRLLSKSFAWRQRLAGSRLFVRLTGWRDKVFARRYQAIPISAEEAAQVERLLYILSNGCKEDLVERPQDWPGIHCVNALLTGQPLKGTWFDRTQEFAARNRGESFGPRG